MSAWYSPNPSKSPTKQFSLQGKVNPITPGCRSLAPELSGHFIAPLIVACFASFGGCWAGFTLSACVWERWEEGIEFFQWLVLKKLQK